MAIDLTKDFDKQVLRRISNLEEVIKDMLSAQSQFADSGQINELMSAISLNIETLKETMLSIERRVSILENNPDLD